MRRLMWFSIGFAAACGLCAYCLTTEWIGAVLRAAVVLALLAGFAGWNHLVFRRIALVFLGISLGCGWYGLFTDRYLGPLEELEGTTRTITVRTTEYGRESTYGQSVYGTVNVEGSAYPAWVLLSDTELLEPGMLVKGEFRISLTAPKEMPVTYLSGEGVFLRMGQAGPVTLEKDPQVRLYDRIARLRQSIRQALAESFPQDALPFAQALLLGDTALLDYKTDTDLKISGIRHVVAVSGLHVSVLFALLSAVTFRRKYLMIPLGLGMLVLFAALAGFSPSVIRACVMSGLMLLALLFNREYDGGTAMAFAALLMLMGNPLVVASVSFQLSVASVSGIYCFRRSIQDWLRSLHPCPQGKLGRKLAIGFDSSVAISLSAMVFTAPLCALYFGMVSLIGVVTNLLTLWLIVVVFYGVMGVCGLAFLWPAGAAFLGKLIAWPIRYVLAVAGAMARVPLAAVYLQSVYLVSWLVFVYVLLVVFYISRNRKPWQLICCSVLGLCLALVASWAEGDQTETRLTVLDVGQGQCILLESEGRTWMVDCGGDSGAVAADLAAQTLLSRGIGDLDGILVTHLEDDHAAGAANLLTRMETRLLILPPEKTDLAALTQGAVVYASEELAVSWENTTLRIFPATFPGTSNEKSLCVLFDTKNCDILITGDRDGFGERMLLRQASIPEVDVLIAGHHGSRHSTCEELLTALRPEYVCISVGDNPFGHPARELLQRLEDFGCTVYRTDRHGTITIRR